MLPLGTENLLAKYLTAGQDPHRLAQQILHGATVRLDAGQANRRLFMLMAGVGFDADVVGRLHAARQGPIRHASYVKPIVDSIRRYEYPELRICVSADPGAIDKAGSRAPTGESITWSARWAFVVNVPRYAMGLEFAPRASSSDGLLNVVTFEHGSWQYAVRYLIAVLRGAHWQLNDCRMVTASHVRIESDARVDYQLDGDPGGTLPLELEILSARVRLVVSERWAVTRGFRHGVEIGSDHWARQTETE